MELDGIPQSHLCFQREIWSKPYKIKEGPYKYRVTYQAYKYSQVDSDNPAFPRSSAYWWLGCSSAPQGTVGGNARLADRTPDEDDVGDIIFDAGMFRHPEVTRSISWQQYYRLCYKVCYNRCKLNAHFASENCKVLCYKLCYNRLTSNVNS